MRQAATAAIVYQEIAQTLSERQARVRQLLREFRGHFGAWPTANELLRFARTEHADCRLWDVNAVRPRLTEMVDQGDVATLPKRRCAVTKKLVFAYLPVERPAPLQVEDLSQARTLEMF